MPPNRPTRLRPLSGANCFFAAFVIVRYRAVCVPRPNRTTFDERRGGFVARTIKMEGRVGDNEWQTVGANKRYSTREKIVPPLPLRERKHPSRPADFADTDIPCDMLREYTWACVSNVTTLLSRRSKRNLFARQRELYRDLPDARSVDEA